MPGPMEIILIIVVLALLFGAKKLPELGKGFGQGIREFKKEVKDAPATVQAAAQTNVTDVPSQTLEPVAGATVQTTVVQTVAPAEERR